MKETKETKVPSISEQKKLPIVVLSQENKVVYGDWATNMSVKGQATFIKNKERRNILWKKIAKKHPL